MGRQNEVSLPYFELDCHMDEKVKLIRAEFGLKGFAVVVMMYQHIYGGDHGYYCEWDDRRLLLFMSDNGLIGESKNLIDEVVQACIREGIFSDRLYKEYGILTSSGIQKQYLKATAKRQVVNLKKEYLLVSVPENRSNVVINQIDSVRKAIDSGINSQSKSKSKSKRNIEGLRLIEEFISAYPKKCNRHLTELEYCKLIRGGTETEENLVTCAKNYAEHCMILKLRDRFIKNAENFLRYFAFEEYLPDKYKRPQAEKKNGFNDFGQNNYDFDKLEKELLSN